ncbi:MAG: LysM domain-containing protein [Acetilactobacillus jinshanensis]
MRFVFISILSFIVTVALSAMVAMSMSRANATSQIIVHTGDTISSIAHKYHVSESSLMAKNHLTGGATLRNGQTITLPDNDLDSSSQGSLDNQDTQDTSKKLPKNEQAAKDWIAFHESRGEYDANNGHYYGKFQLDPSLLHGDYSKANQEKTADNYVHNRYGDWIHAKRFWEAHNWY